jgi:hypothetical protein
MPIWKLLGLLRLQQAYGLNCSFGKCSHDISLLLALGNL